MQFNDLAEVFEELEKTSSSLAMQEILAQFFAKIKKENIKIITYLLQGQISSEYESVVLNMAEKSVLKAIASASGKDLSLVQKTMQESGDAGLTAEKMLKTKPRTLIPVGDLSVKELYEKLHKIVTTSGLGSQDQKVNLLVSLLQKTFGIGAKYVTRIALGTLRIGAGDMTLLNALAIAFTEDKKNKDVLENAFNICPDLGEIAEILAEKGLRGLKNIDVRVGRPIKMMLAQRVKEIEEIAEKIPGEFTAEAKYDGERIQAHKNTKGQIYLFSRRLENITDQFPDLVKELEKQIQAKDFVVEGEVIAIDKDEKPLPFQHLMQRRRKHDIEEYVKKIPVQLKLFDLLYANGKTYLNESYVKRTDKLAEIVKKSMHIMLADKIITQSIGEMDDFFRKMLKEGYEGVIVKSRAEDSFYQAGTRGWNWIKWKKEYAKELIDTFDLVIVGAFYGKGKRSGVYGALLCAAYDSKDDDFKTVCKLGTGLTDEMLEELPKKMKKYVSEKQPSRVVVKKEMVPDVWFKPDIIVEVLAAEVTKSPYHSAEYALRFPRFLRFREKKAEQATTVKEIVEMA